MDMKSIFLRWKNGWRALRRDHTSSLVIEALPDIATKKAIEWCNAIRSSYACSFGYSWNPWDKFLWLYGLSDKKAESCVKLYEYFGRPESPMIPNEFVHVIAALTQVLHGDGQFTYTDRTAAGTYCGVLSKAIKEPEWVSLTRAVFPCMAEGENKIVGEYLKQQYALKDQNISSYKLAILVWDISGRPDEPDYRLVQCPVEVARLKRIHYHNAIQQLRRTIARWSNLGWECCDHPNEFEPGVNALYKHTCRYDPPEVTPMVNKKDVILVKIYPNGPGPGRWYVRTDKGEFPVTFGGEPDNMDLMIHPFYRFEPGLEHGLSSCVIRVASGTEGYYWYIRVLKSFEIHSIRDPDGDLMECIAIPGDSPALALMRINCELRDML